MNGDALGFVHRLVQNCAKGTVSHKNTIQELPLNVSTLEYHLNLKFRSYLACNRSINTTLTHRPELRETPISIGPVAQYIKYLSVALINY